MERKRLYDYYWLGTGIRYLQDAQAGFTIHSKNTVIPNIDSLFYWLDHFGLAVTNRSDAVTELRKFRDELPEDKDGKAAVLSVEQAASLKQIIKDIRGTLEAELSGFSVFFVSPKRIDVNKLLEDIPGLFPPGVYGELPEIARYDFSEAGRCIAFERPTAAAFHMLRGTEAMLRHFYCTLVRQKRVKVLLWGSVVGDLRNRRKTKEYETLYNNLDNIRESYRNPTQHPEATYDIHEAQDLWGLCTEAVNRMIKILRAA